MLDAFRFARCLGIVQIFSLGLSLANARAGRDPTRRLITQPINDGNRVTLTGNTCREANATNDRGPVPESLPMQHLQLLLRLPMEQEEELDKLLRAIQDPNSPNYHKFLTPEQFSLEFSLAPEDVRTISGWLRSMGFSINLIGPRSIDLSGTAGQVHDAFKTEIHYLDVAGVRHIANMSDPQIPAALEPQSQALSPLTTSNRAQ